MADKDEDDEDDDFGRPFTPRERRRLRRMMRDDDRVDWLKTSVKVWIVTIGAVAGAVTAAYAAWSQFIRPLFRP